jgi:NADPH:quinone reductase-like Zn-dependent oxidoreductase
VLGRSPASAAPRSSDIVDLPDPVPGDGEQLYEVSAGGVNFADINHRMSANAHQRCPWPPSPRKPKVQRE